VKIIANEVHEMCTEPSEAKEMPRTNASENPTELRFYLKTGNQVDFGTSDYESGALTN